MELIQAKQLKSYIELSYSTADSMLNQLSRFTDDHFISIDLKKKFLIIMGQLINYLSSVFSGLSLPGAQQQKSNKSTNHVTFAENSFSQLTGSNEQAAKLDSLRQSNRRTIFTYEFITIAAFLIHFSMVLWPRVQLESFSILETESWQFITINLIPAFVQFVAIYAMIDLNRPLPEGSKLTSKNSGLELDQNEFVRSLKVVVCLVALAQVGALYSDQLLWSVILILPLWCCQLTTRLTNSEFNRHAPNPKKSWRLRLGPDSPRTPTTPKTATPKKSAQSNSAKKETEAKATPRTRTRRAVKSFINNATDKYHQLEQSVAQQISSLQNMGSPLRRDNKMIEYST